MIAVPICGVVGGWGLDKWRGGQECRGRQYRLRWTIRTQPLTPQVVPDCPSPATSFSSSSARGLAGCRADICASAHASEAGHVCGFSQKALLRRDRPRRRALKASCLAREGEERHLCIEFGGMSDAQRPALSNPVPHGSEHRPCTQDLPNPDSGYEIAARDSENYKTA